MKISQTIPRPANWQDFEDLCKKLWGEIWECKEIQKHGRLGQDQSGVDIFGTPKGEDNCYGIQCKGRIEYNHKQLTEKEINDEIEAAKSFEPPLKKLYLATTAQNDTKVQAYVRKLNMEHKNQGLFEVHVFGWESIVDLIFENRRTHDTYVMGSNFRLESELPCLKVLENKYWLKSYTMTIENSGSDLFGLSFGKETKNGVFKVHIMGRPEELATGGTFTLRFEQLKDHAIIAEDTMSFIYEDRNGKPLSQILSMRHSGAHASFGPRYSLDRRDV